MKKQLLCLIITFLTLLSGTLAYAQNGTDFEADVVVYGGTSAGIIAAVQVNNMGKSVIVVSPDKHIGGVSASGLGYTDVGNKAVIGGLSRDFYNRVYLHYAASKAWKWEARTEFGNKGQGTAAIDGENRTMWIFEPHVAEQIFEDYIKEGKIRILRDEWLDREKGLKMENGRIIVLKTLSGKTFRGKIFIDATYEGDLMAAAGVKYRIGREACSEYNETFNGVQVNVFHHQHYFKDKIDPYKIPGKPESGLVPLVSSDNPGVNCSGDSKIQTYCFRTCMSNRPDNTVQFPKPEGYDSTQYELLARVFEAGWRDWFGKFDMIPNRKTDTNNHGPFSSDYIGMNYNYPEGSYKVRKEIFKQHEIYQKGLLWFVAHSRRVPKEIREKMKNWGLAKDEFADNGNWPYQMYVRESRRMVGEYVMNENDLFAKRIVPEPVGMGSYAMDSHNVQRFVTKEGFVQNEGDIGVSPKKPYLISYRSMTPKKKECSNLLVPVCISSSHIAYGSVRMEPVFMILGQSAGIAAALAADKGIAVQDVNYENLKKELIRYKQLTN
ncbi:MAG: FAD-dependent oxidoreductase [Mariniphaga sp.]